MAQNMMELWGKRLQASTEYVNEVGMKNNVEIFPSDMSGIAFGNTLLLVKFTSPNISCNIMRTYRKESLRLRDTRASVV